MVVPLFLFAAVVMLGLFPLLTVQLQVAGALQYASRAVAASICDPEDELGDAAYLAEGEVLFRGYLREHGLRESSVKGGSVGISLLGSDFSDEYVTMQANYSVKLPISFWRLDQLPVQQRVRCRKWTGMAESAEEADQEADGYVYVTPSGKAYHSSTSCRYLDLSIQSTTLTQAKTQRNRSGGKYYACSCYSGKQSMVYITQYGTNYHSDLSCPGLKRTIYRVQKEEAADRHACSGCAGEQ